MVGKFYLGCGKKSKGTRRRNGTKVPESELPPNVPRVVGDGLVEGQPLHAHDYSSRAEVRNPFDQKPYLCAIDFHQLSAEDHARVEFALAHPELGVLRRTICSTHTGLMDRVEFVFMTFPIERLRQMAQDTAEKKSKLRSQGPKILAFSL